MNFTEHKKDIIAISALLIIVTTITLLLLNIDLKVGVYYVRDVYFYLNNALFYAGYNTGFVDTRGLSPLIPMITSIFFRMGFISDKTIIIVSSVFYIFTSLEMYFLLRLKFKELLSFTGSMILSTFPLIIVWVTKGMLDIPGLCLSIWSVYFMILSFRKNIKYLYIAFPLVVLGFFTRFTVILMVPVLLIQFLLMDKPFNYIKENIKHIIGGIIAGGAVFAVFIGIYIHFDIGMFFLSQGGGISQSTQSVIDTHYNNIFYYINNFPIYLGTEHYIPYSLKPGRFIINEMKWMGGYPSIISYILQAILIAGAILYFKKLLSKENREIIKKDNYKLKLAIIIVGIVLFALTFIKISIILSIILISIPLLAFYRLCYKTEMDDFNLDFIMLYWFVINFIFFTYYHIKVDRYFMPMLPFIAYSIILSLTLIFDKLKSAKNIDKIKIAAPIALIGAILLCNASFALVNSPHTFDNQIHPNFETASSEEADVANWLMNFDSNYENKTIWADRGGDMSFFLRMEIPSLDGVSNSSNFTSLLLDNNVTYFITKDNKTINAPYTKIYQSGEVSLYYRKY